MKYLKIMEQKHMIKFKTLCEEILNQITYMNKEKTYVFLLPIKNRPTQILPINIRGKYWHTGIIQDGKVYETFSNHKFKISDFNENDSIFFGMELIEVPRIEESLLQELLQKGLPCDNYVNSVLGFPLTKDKTIVRVNFPKIKK